MTHKYINITTQKSGFQEIYLYAYHSVTFEHWGDLFAIKTNKPTNQPTQTTTEQQILF